MPPATTEYLNSWYDPRVMFPRTTLKTLDLQRLHIYEVIYLEE